MSVSSGNTFYVTTTSSAGTDSTYVRDRNIQVTQVILTPNAAGDVIEIADMEAASVAVGSAKLKIKAEANGTKVIDLADSPVRFANGIWISSLSASAVCTLVFNKQG